MFGLLVKHQGRPVSSGSRQKFEAASTVPSGNSESDEPIVCLCGSCDVHF